MVQVSGDAKRRSNGALVSKLRHFEVPPFYYNTNSRIHTKQTEKGKDVTKVRPSITQDIEMEVDNTHNFRTEKDRWIRKNKRK